MNFSALSPASRVAVVSPSGPVLPENIEGGLAVLRSWGLEPELLAPFERHRGYLAGTDTHRLAQMQRAFSGEYEAVFCTRGGFGATRIVDQITADASPILVGFSDITALHLRFFRAMPCIHGPVLKSMPSQPAATQTLRRLLMEGPQPRSYPVLAACDGAAQGPVIAANLSVLVASLDTPWFPDLAGHIVVLEDVGEVDYRLDRLLTTARHARALQGIAGLILGEFNNCAGVYVDEDAMADFLADLAREFGVPAAYGFPSGHLGPNEPVILGELARLDTAKGVVELGC